MLSIYLGSLPLNCIPWWLIHIDLLIMIIIEEDIGLVEVIKRLLGFEALFKLSKFFTKTIIAAEYVESKHLTKLKHKE